MTASPSSTPALAPLSSHMVFGAYTPDLPSSPGALTALEQQLGHNVAIASGFVDWKYVFGGPSEVSLAAGGRRTVLLSWEPNGVRFTDVTSGAEDSYLQQIASSMRQYPYTLYVRPWPEMNGPWSSWQPTANGSHSDGGTPKQFIAAWRYLVTFMRSRGVDNLKFVFNPDASTFSGTTPISDIWPGSQYVDVMAMDGYNWGNSALGAIDTGDRWQSFDEIFAPMYRILTSLDSTAPVWIAEFGCKEPTEEDDWNYPTESSPIDPAHDKGTWIRQALASAAFPRITALVYFDKSKERDWRLDSSPGALAAARLMASFSK